MHDAPAPLHEGAGGLVIDRGQRANVTDQLIQQGRLDQVRLLRDEGLLCQHHFLGSHRVSGEQAPVNVAAVSQVWVIRVLWETQQLEQFMGWLRLAGGRGHRLLTGLGSSINNALAGQRPTAPT